MTKHRGKRGGSAKKRVKHLGRLEENPRRWGFAAEKWSFAMAGLAAIAFLFTFSISEAAAIDVYHILVQYKNGRIAEKMATHSEENYKNFFEGYVENAVLLNKKEYSLHQFIQTFGEKNYDQFMAGYFGFGLEEEIIFQRNAGGLGVNPQALPPPDKKSKMLEKKLNEILRRDRKTGDVDPLNRSTLQNPGPPLPAQSNDSGFLVNCSFQEGGVNLPVNPHPENPKESDEKESFGPEIIVYRFSAEYINGRIVEKASTQLPEKYHRHYKGYVKKVALIERKAYTMKEFKRTFGEKNCNLLIQGLFGKDAIDIVMENRIKRGIPPDKSVLPAPSMDSNKLAKRQDKRIGKNQ